MKLIDWSFKYLKYYQGFNQAIWLNVFGVFVNNFGFITGSFFALYLIHDKNLSIHTAALFMSLGSVGSIIGSYLGGSLADRYAPVRLAQWTLFLFALGVLTLPFLNRPSAIFIGLFLVNMIFSAFRPVNNIILMAHSTIIDRPRVMGMYRMAFNLGLAFSMVIGSFLAEHNFTWYFYFAGSMSLFATLLFIRFQKPMALPASWKKEVQFARHRDSLRTIFKDKPFLLLSCIYLGYCVVYFQIRMTFAIYITEIYHLPLALFGYLYMINLLMVVFFEVPLMDIFKLHNQINICIWGMLFIAVGLGMLPFGHGFAFAALSVFLWSIGEIFTSSPFYVLVMEYANPQARGAYMGFFQSVMSLGGILFPVVGGFLYPIAGGKVLWLGCFFASFILIFGFLKLNRMKRASA